MSLQAVIEPTQGLSQCKNHVKQYNQPINAIIKAM